MTGEDALRAALHRMLGDTPDGADPRLRVGVDLVHVPRAAAVARRHGERWLADQFTPREREQLAAADGTPTPPWPGGSPRRRRSSNCSPPSTS
ncbi:4'-phosphopantetheinyl transferase family protein [Kitasatospora fiedleri]|uniref:4'-phosphopantetheinyl transferase family protein n=1 Tax=Kitasatospora fiedleri TaxID=2991545 RepID=UPI00249C31F6|nr:4'-phosphopantetheinyl transferase superfamily protein [Kitasatospora fiedleri]